MFYFCLSSFIEAIKIYIFLYFVSIYLPPSAHISQYQKSVWKLRGLGVLSELQGNEGYADCYII